MNTIFLSGAILLIAILLYGRRKPGSNSGNKTLSLLKKRQCYQPRAFMTDRERIFFRSLCCALSGHSLLVMAQVRLADVVRVSSGFTAAQSRTLFRQISQWHCDFVVVDSRDFSVKAVIELDDRSHLRPERQRRDEIFNLVVIQAGIPLYRPRSVKQAKEVADCILRRV
ncbi:UNVERIFIED_ORG: uncharacterized protein DUF2726 [Citrobacter freundii]